MFGRGNGIDVIIRAVDKFTGPMDRIMGKTRRSTSGLDRLANIAPQGAVGKAIFGIGVSATLAGLAAVTAGVGLLTRELQRAANVEVAVIGKSHDIAKNMGIGAGAARGIYDTVESDLAKAAGPLPGTTSDYTNIFNQIAGGLSRAVPDQDEFERLGVDISKRVGVLAQKAGADPSMGGSAINRAILGTSGLGELRQIDIFQKSDVGVAITDELNKLGKEDKDWKNLTAALRVQVLENALKYATPDAMISEMSTGAAAITESWMSSLFDPLVGAFGVRRDVESRGKSAVDAYTELLQSLDYMFSAINRVTGLGNIDPMGKVIDFIDWLADLVDSVSRALDMGKGLRSVFGGLGAATGEFIGAAIGYLPKLALIILRAVPGLIRGIHSFMLNLTIGFFKGFFGAAADTGQWMRQGIREWLDKLFKKLEDALIGWVPFHQTALEKERAANGNTPSVWSNPVSLGAAAGGWLRDQIPGNTSNSTSNSFTVNVDGAGSADPDEIAARAVERLKAAFVERSEMAIAN